jgi:hypothetical protein
MTEEEIDEGDERQGIVERLGVWALPLSIMLSWVLFSLTPGGRPKFGIAIFSIIPLFPLGALMSFTFLMNSSVHRSGPDAWPEWFLRSFRKRFLLSFLLVFIIAFITVLLGSILGYKGIMATWLLLWVLVMIRLSRGAGVETRDKPSQR